ncbi:A/G-specific adenine glycosylase [Massilia sp. TS11]|uniref:A/G-specific adenine glycosylase n=1 Tax=Massilia sp. TS11 TaxID=2908003 RepID=UPI001EDA417F|nr:A/G-specific adenine glycosylase [Massilia sp. TS11]MCG2584916.1 A/G-specific adenine glycosylase [Massilia sp. TS11]
MKRLSSRTIDADPSFSATVIDWQRQHGRHALPWQNTRDAYRIWLSEIMLQQTQVSAVLGYYARFLERFPTLPDLARADSAEVMALWSGLGYYTRARNLHKCAQQVLADYGGAFPTDPALLAALPGIGRSTAAAIAAFSSGARAAILDGNVKRVFARVFGVEGYPGEKRVEDALWQRAEALLPQDGIESYTQGLMDLGATICTRSRPACERCPLRTRCVALASERVAELPHKKPPKTTPEKRAQLLLLRHEDSVLLAQRPDSGIWGGLLSLPEVDGHQSKTRALDPTAARMLAAQYGTIAEIADQPLLLHVFTHYRLHILPLRVQLAERAPVPPGHHWLPLEAALQTGLPAPIRKLLETERETERGQVRQSDI